MTIRSQLRQGLCLLDDFGSRMHNDREGLKAFAFDGPCKWAVDPLSFCPLDLIMTGLCF